MKIVVLPDAFLEVLVVTLCLGIASAWGQTVGDAPIVSTYPNTPAGLEDLMSNMIDLQKKGDSKRLRRICSRLCSEREGAPLKQTTLSFFVYAEGAFRYLGMLHKATFAEFRKVKNAIVNPALVQRTVVLQVVAGPDGKARQVTYVRGPEVYKEAAIESTKKRHFDLPQYPFEAFHAKTISFCIDVVAPH